MSGYESFNPDDHQDPFDPRLLGASRMAQLSPDDADDYISQQMAHGEPTDNNWFAQFDDPHNFSSLPPGHKWVQFADEVDDGEDPRYFQAVPESTPEGHERWHVRGAEGGWRYDPHELVFHDHLPPGLQRGEFGIWSPIKDTGHENWNPDDKQDPFDPRLIGASLHLAANEELLQKLHDDFHDWYAENGNERLNWAGRGPLGNWHQIENFLKDRYPAAHKNITTGKEQAGHLLDTGHIGEDGTDYCPKCEDHPFDKKNCAYCGGTGQPPSPLAYETGPDAVARHGYDPKEVAAGMLLLHNRTHPHRSDLEQGDNDRLSEIARMRSQMMRGGSLDMADIIRLAGDGMSWEDTMRHIDEALAAGEPEDHSDYSTDYSVNHYDGVDTEEDRLAEQARRNQEEDDLTDRLWNEWMGQLSGKHHRWLEEVNPKAMDHDFAAYHDHHVNGTPYTMTPVPQDELHRQQQTLRSPHTAALDMADLIRLAGDGMSWEDTMAHIDAVLAEGEGHRLPGLSEAGPGQGEEECEECGAVIPVDEGLINPRHEEHCSLHPNNSY